MKGPGDVALRAVNLSKIYRSQPLRLANLFSRRPPASAVDDPEATWALKDVTLEIYKGETFGLLGRNGAGKSTFLQLVSGILAPSAGSIKKFIAATSFLELGSGFDHSYSGRDNIFFAGQMLGLTYQEIERKYDEIVAFSEVGPFIHKPLRTYSSGMVMRLAFAVQAAVEPDLLIIDEALSVGDIKFQEKCFSRLRALKDRGATILFVSHDTNVVAGFCDRVGVLESGRLLDVGPPREMIQLYFSRLNSTTSSAPTVTVEATLNDPETDNLVRVGSKEVRILKASILNEKAEETVLLVSGETYTLTQTVEVDKDIVGMSSGFLIRTKSGVDVFGATTQTLGSPIHALSAGSVVTISMRVTMHLGAGDYFLQAANASPDGRQYDCLVNALHFKVQPTPQIFTTSLANLRPELSVIYADEGARARH